MSVEIRPARATDEAALLEIDAATRSAAVTPAPDARRPGPFFGDRVPLDGTLVASVGGVVAGLVALARPTGLASNTHVFEIRDLAVSPRFQRQGVASALLAAARVWVAERGGRRITLRVLSTNPGAVALYRASGFELEGTLRGEFRIGDEDVDDLLMALRI